MQCNFENENFIFTVLPESLKMIKNSFKNLHFVFTWIKLNNLSSILLGMSLMDAQIFDDNLKYNLK